MSEKVHYTVCPVCASTGIHPLLTVKDESVSGEQFVIWQCDQCTLRFTQDVPDESSIGKYYQSPDYISHTNTNKGLLNKLYRGVRHYTLRQKADLVTKFTGISKGKLLDIGCGIGAFLHEMKERGWQVEGVEPDGDTRSRAQSLFQLQLKEPSAIFTLPAASFDAITLWHVLEHVHDLHPYVEQMKMLLKDNGKIFIAVPNYQSLDADIYRLKWAAYDVPRHLYHFTPKSIKALVQQHGLKVVDERPMWLDAFYISLLSSKYRNGYTNWFGAGISGVRSNINALLNKERCSSLIYVISKE